jgi:hypothetical protein
LSSGSRATASFRRLAASSTFRGVCLGSSSAKGAWALIRWKNSSSKRYSSRRQHSLGSPAATRVLPYSFMASIGATRSAGDRKLYYTRTINWDYGNYLVFHISSDHATF